MDNAFEVYVDGSFRNGLMGVGWLINKPDDELYLKGSQKYTLHDQLVQDSSMAEFLAILNGLRRVPPKSNVTLYCDSKSALDVLEGTGQPHERYKQVVIEIHQASHALGNIELRWVQGHSGNPHNETVHVLAELKTHRGQPTRPGSKAKRAAWKRSQLA